MNALNPTTPVLLSAITLMFVDGLYLNLYWLIPAVHRETDYAAGDL